MPRALPGSVFSAEFKGLAAAGAAAATEDLRDHARMRANTNRQFSLGQPSLDEIVLDDDCRFELTPILAGLRHLHGQPERRPRLLDLVAADILGRRRGRPGTFIAPRITITILFAAAYSELPCPPRLFSPQNGSRTLSHLFSRDSCFLGLRLP